MHIKVWQLQIYLSYNTCDVYIINSDGKLYIPGTFARSIMFYKYKMVSFSIDAFLVFTF